MLQVLIKYVICWDELVTKLMHEVVVVDEFHIIIINMCIQIINMRKYV